MFSQKQEKEEYQFLINEINSLDYEHTLEKYNELKPKIERFFKNAKDVINLDILKDKITSIPVFRTKEADIGFFLEFISDLKGVANRCVWEILFTKLWYHKFDEKKENIEANQENDLGTRIIASLRCSDKMLTKIYLYRKYTTLFSFSEWYYIFGDKTIINLHKIKISNTKDLVNATLSFFRSEKLSLEDLYEEITKIIEQMKNQEDENILKNMKNWLAELLSLWGFPPENEIIKLFDSFMDVEKDLVNVLGVGYYEHILHSLRVFLLGFQLIAIIRDYENRFDKNQFKIDILGWVIASFFHDLGYGVEKINKLTSSIQRSYTNFGKVDASSFIISESGRIIAEKLMNSMEKIIKLDNSEYSFLPDEFEHLKINPILKSWDEKNHGIISSVVFWQSLIDLVARDYTFYLKHQRNWNDIFYRVLLAMTLHSMNPDHAYYFNFDVPKKNEEGLSPSYDINEHPLLISFILLLFDTIEYIERRTFTGKTYLDVAQPNIDLELEIDFNYSLKRYIEVNISAIYDNMNENEIVEIADKILPKFYGFSSYNYGVNMSLQNKGSSKKVIFPLLRSEYERFDAYTKDNNIKTEIKEIEELHELYKSYFFVILTENGYNEQEIETIVREKDLKHLIPKRVSFQIYCFASMKKKFMRNFDRFKADEKFLELI